MSGSLKGIICGTPVGWCDTDSSPEGGLGAWGGRLIRDVAPSLRTAVRVPGTP
ncbi:hypothetical protein Alo02nite_31600 [Actinoplanes lobatus]|uniref:Uncharacterized protein n=1 Tax=Actinoplanes lobatus TaxID=113568 RepID=A0ABQ4AGY1_9ACTN|nr:hypothetical protein Alo02nite_31600 [Actinoplanes lobatus]